MRPTSASLLVILFAFCFPAGVFSQEAEVKKHIDLAAELLKQQNYAGAHNELDKAKVETQKLVTAQLEKVYPAAVGTWMLVKEQQMPGMMPITGPGGYISVTRSYEQATEKSKTKEDSLTAMYMQPRMIVSISNDTFLLSNINSVHKNSNNTNAATTPGAIATSGAPATPGTPGMPATTTPMGMPGEEVKAIQVKGFKAVSRLNAAMKMSSLSVQTGKGVIQIHGMQMDTMEPLLKLAEGLDLNKVAEIFGKK